MDTGSAAIGRSVSQRAALERQGAEVVDADLFDATALRRVLAGHEAVVNLATHMPSSSMRMLLRWSWRENDRVRRDGSAALVDAALGSGVRRFVQESFAPIFTRTEATSGSTSGGRCVHGVTEAGAYTEGSVKASAESYAFNTFGRLFGISRNLFRLPRRRETQASKRNHPAGRGFGPPAALFHRPLVPRDRR